MQTMTTLLFSVVFLCFLFDFHYITQAQNLTHDVKCEKETLRICSNDNDCCQKEIYTQKPENNAYTIICTDKVDAKNEFVVDVYQHLINGNDHRLNIDSMMIAKSTELNKINITILVSEQAKMLDINCYHNDNVTQRQVHFCSKFSQPTAICESFSVSKGVIGMNCAIKHSDYSCSYWSSKIELVEIWKNGNYSKLSVPLRDDDCLDCKIETMCSVVNKCRYYIKPTKRYAFKITGHQNHLTLYVPIPSFQSVYNYEVVSAEVVNETSDTCTVNIDVLVPLPFLEPEGYLKQKLFYGSSEVLYSLTLDHSKDVTMFHGLRPGEIYVFSVMMKIKSSIYPPKLTTFVCRTKFPSDGLNKLYMPLWAFIKKDGHWIYFILSEDSRFTGYPIQIEAKPYVRNFFIEYPYKVSMSIEEQHLRITTCFIKNVNTCEDTKTFVGNLQLKGTDLSSVIYWDNLVKEGVYIQWNPVSHAAHYVVSWCSHFNWKNCRNKLQWFQISKRKTFLNLNIPINLAKSVAVSACFDGINGVYCSQMVEAKHKNFVPMVTNLKCIQNLTDGNVYCYWTLNNHVHSNPFVNEYEIVIGTTNCSKYLFIKSRTSSVKFSCKDLMSFNISDHVIVKVKPMSYMVFDENPKELFGEVIAQKLAINCINPTSSEQPSEKEIVSETEYEKGKNSEMVGWTYTAMIIAGAVVIGIVAGIVGTFYLYRRKRNFAPAVTNNESSTSTSSSTYTFSNHTPSSSDYATIQEILHN